MLGNASIGNIREIKGKLEMFYPIPNIHMTRLCHRWIPRGWQGRDNAEYHEDDFVEECQSDYAPQSTDKCECDDSIECIEDSSSGILVFCWCFLLNSYLQLLLLLEEQTPL